MHVEGELAKHMTDRAKPTQILLPFALAVATLLSACGGGGSNSSDETPGTGTTSTPVGTDAVNIGDTVSAAPSTALETESPLRLDDRLGQAPESSDQSTLQTTLANRLAMSENGTAVVQPSALTSVTLAASVAQSLIYVSPTGNDSWSGSLTAVNTDATDGPVRSITRAQALVRAQLAAMSQGTRARVPVRVLLAPGEYRLSAALEFTTADSGVAGAPVSYEATSAGTVTITGGVSLGQRTASAGVPVSFSTTMSIAEQVSGGQLFVNGRRAILARQPNQDRAWFVQKQLVLPTEPSGQAGREAFTPPGDALNWVNALNATDRKRAILNVMQSWSSGHHRFVDEGVPNGAIRIQPRASRAFLAFGPSQRFFVENVAAALDAPREWLPTAGGPAYIPDADESGQTISAVLPTLEKLVTIKGDFAATRWVSHLHFKGLNFSHTRHLIPAGGYMDPQAGVDISAAIEVDGAQFLQFDNCNVSKTGGYAVWFRRAVRDSSITNSSFADLGAGGLKLGQANQSLTDAMKTGNNAVTGNRISDTGKVFPGSVGIWLGQTFDTVVANNAITNTSYTGISIGWTWGYGAITSGRNTIANNLLVNIGRAQLSDVGGIYTVGISPGTTIRGNVIREVRSYPGYGPGGWGIYSDEGASETLIQDNVVIGTDSGGYQLNYGRNNIVNQNLFAQGDAAEIRVARTDPLLSKLAMRNNLLLPKVRQPFDSFAMAPDVLYSTNIVSAAASPAGLDLAKCGTGCGRADFTLATSADPRNITLTGVDATIATRMQNIAKTAGPIEVAGVVPPPVVVAPPPVVVVAPPTAFSVDIAGAPIGTQPAGLQYLPKGNVNAVGVVTKAGAPAGRCLAYNDSAAFRYSYEPYTYTSLNHETGISTMELGLIIDSAASFNVEWRDAGNPYKSGPAMQISAAGIRVKGRIVAAAPVGQWFTLVITAPVDNPTGLWTLQVRNAGGTVTSTVNNLAFATTGWSKFKWLGMISETTSASTVCLSKLQITNTSP